MQPYTLDADTIPRREVPEGFEDFDEKLIRPSFVKAIGEVRENRKWPVYLYSESGRGKSYSMAWAYRYAVRSGNTVEWHDVSQLVRTINRCRCSDSGSVRYGGHEVYEGSLFDRIKSARLCCFDDLGIRGPTDAMYDVLYELVSCRRGKPTIYTSNLKPDALRKIYDSRIASRVLEGTWMEMTGDDQRVKKSTVVKV